MVSTHMEITTMLCSTKIIDEKLKTLLTNYGYQILACYQVGSSCIPFIKNPHDLDIKIYCRKLYDNGLQIRLPKQHIDNICVDYHLVTPEKEKEISKTDASIWIDCFYKKVIKEYHETDSGIDILTIKNNYKNILHNTKKYITSLLERKNNNSKILKHFYYVCGLIYVCNNNFTNNFSIEQQQMLNYLHDRKLPPQFENQLDFYNYLIKEVDKLLK